MATTKISALTELAVAPDSGDKLVIVDVSDTTDAVTGTTKFIQTGNLGFQPYDANLPTWPATVDATEVGYLNGVTSAIQTQLDGKSATSHTHELDELNATGITAGYILQADGANGAQWVIDAGGGGSFDATADGAIADGDACIIQSDGTVAAVAISVGAISASADDAFTAASTSRPIGVYDTGSNKVVIGFYDGATADVRGIVGTVSGTSLTFGTEVSISGAASAGTMGMAYDSTNNKTVFAYTNNFSYARSVVGTVSGTSISFGTEANVNGGTTATSYVDLCYDSGNSVVVVAFNDGGNSNYGTAQVGTVSGTTISYGTEAVFESANTTDISIAYDANAGKVVIVYADGGNSNYGTAVVGTVSGTTISFGTPVTFYTTNAVRDTAICYDSTNQKMVISFADTTTGFGHSVVGTVSGTTITFGSVATFASADTFFIKSEFNPSTGNVVVIFYDNGNSGYGTVIEGTVSGTAITFGSEVVYYSAALSGATSQTRDAVIYDPDNTQMVAIFSDSSPAYGRTAVLTNSLTTNLTTENFVGFSDGAYADTATATIQVAGSTDDAQSGLTVGQAYWVQQNGSLGLTPDEPAVFAGTALSATKLLIGTDTNAASRTTPNTFAGATTFGAEVVETVYALSGTTPAFEPANGTIQTWTLSANSTPTDSLAAGEAITLMIDDGTAYTITWPTMTWVNNGGSAPTLATTGYTVVALWKVGTTLYGALVGNGA